MSEKMLSDDELMGVTGGLNDDPANAKTLTGYECPHCGGGIAKSRDENGKLYCIKCKKLFSKLYSGQTEMRC